MRSFEADFLRRGSLLALGSALGSFRGLITVVALSAFGSSTVSVYGIALGVYGVAVVLCAGHGVAVISRLSRFHAGLDEHAESRPHFVEIISTAWASTIVLLLLTATFGTISAILLPVDTALFIAAYTSATIGAVLLPLSQCLIGKQLVLGLERISTVHFIETFIIGVGLALIGVLLSPSANIALLAVGIGGVLADAWGFIRRYRSLGPGDRGTVRAGLASFIAGPMRPFRGVLRVAAGGYDGVVLLVAFTVVSQLALQVSPLTGAVTVTLIATIRSIVIPLKSVGLVGGRLIVQNSPDGVINSSLVRRAIRAVAYILVPIGALITLSPEPVQYLLGLPTGPDVELVVRLMGVQLMLEPITGVGSAMLKVIVKPTTVLLPLTLCMWGFAVPAVAISAALDTLSLLNIWTVLIAARIAFGICVTAHLIRACTHELPNIAHP